MKNVETSCPDVAGFVTFNFITYSLLIAELAMLWFGYEVRNKKTKHFRMSLVQIEYKCY
jgi:hypothetical protein